MRPVKTLNENGAAKPAFSWKELAYRGSSYARKGCHEAVMESPFHLCAKLNRIISVLMQCWEMLKKSAQKKSWEATLARVKNEMAIPPMAKSARHAIFRQKWGNNQPMRSNIEAPSRISFNFAGVLTLNESFAAGETIFSEGDTAETLMYIQAGRVKLSVASEAGEVAIVSILGPGEFLGEACLGSQNNIRIRTATAIAPTALQVIERNEMIRALRTDRALSYAFLSYLILSNIRIEEDFVESVAFSKYIAVSNANGGIHTDSYRLD